MRKLIVAALAAVLLNSLLPRLDAQEYAASLAITITDPSGALVPQTHIVLKHAEWGTVHEGDTNAAGAFIVDSLRPGVYTLDAAKGGFENVHIDRLVVAVRDRQALHLDLRVAGGATSVTVTGTAAGVSTDVSQGISVDQNYIQNLPVNGRNMDALIMMTPGITRADGGRGGGGLNANGLRGNMNYYTLDGLSMNSPMAGGPGGGRPPGGGGPGGGMMMPMGGGAGGEGGMADMPPMDGLQEMRVQTSPIAPEFGRTPGAQISMTSRGGSNRFNGSAYYYFRNDRLNANDWFANASGYTRSPMRQNRPGGTFGGPLFKNRTYFFISQDSLRLDTPNTVVSSVPTIASRRAAPASLRMFLNAFPTPNGADLGDGAAEFRAVVVNPSRSDSTSLRLDHILTSKITLFARFSQSTSNGQSRGSEMTSPNMLGSNNMRSQTATGGGTYTSSANVLHDFRFNYSQSNSRGFSIMDDFGGAVPLKESKVFPDGVTGDTGMFSLSILGVGGYSLGGRQLNAQKQMNGVYSVTKTAFKHTWKAGADMRTSMPTMYNMPYRVGYTFNGLAGGEGAMSSAVATNVQVSSNVDAVYPIYHNFSAYGQDTWRATERTTLTYGLRWDLNPAPGVRKGERPLVLVGDDVENDVALYHLRLYDIAPRLGLAYQMDTTQGHETMFRAGAGVFYDVGYGSSGGAFSGAPYSNSRTISLATFPLSSGDAAPPAMPPEEPYGIVTGVDSTLKSPVVFQWNVSIEHAFGEGQTLTVAYTGSRGRRLLRSETQPSFGDVYEMARLDTNGATSDYNGMQVQFRRRFSARLQTQLSYTWAHSMDSSSNEMGGGFASLFGSGEHASSDYDIRQNLNFSGSYRVYGMRKGIVGRVLGPWYIDWLVTSRTGLPFDIMGVSSTTSSKVGSTPMNYRGGAFAQVRPDYNGAAVWISDPNVPGGRRLNADAFDTPDGYTQGNLARNSLRGFGSYQADVSLRRQFALTERVQLNLSAQAYNVTNHPNFANPSSNEGANMASPNFGVMTRMLNGSFGRGGSPYGSGGPRSIELVLRLQF